tara:strand:- start:7391 stop:7753 length:363 start_codon:yes stop_codon:yes gene_type:complete
MTRHDRERRKQQRLKKLGSNNPICGACGENAWQCLEAHHVADFGRDEATVIVCANCHRKLSDTQNDHPGYDASSDPDLDRIGHFLLGLADLLEIIVEKLKEFAHLLIGLAEQDADRGRGK